MVGKSAQIAEEENALPAMYKLHKRLFPVLMRLACDVDQVRARRGQTKLHLAWLTYRVIQIQVL